VGSQPAGILHRVAAKVVVEIGVHVAAFAEPIADSFGRRLESAGAKPAKVLSPGLQSAGPVKPDVRPIGRQQPGVVREQVMEAQRGLVPSQDLERFIMQPRGLAEFDRPSHAFRRNRKELVQPLGIRFQRGGSCTSVGPRDRSARSRWSSG
jgi:hypothetical protein